MIRAMKEKYRVTKEHVKRKEHLSWLRRHAKAELNM